MHTKWEINKLLSKAIFKKCVVSCIQLEEKYIHDYKLGLKKNKDNSSNSDEPAKKKPKMNTNEIYVTAEVPPTEIDDDESTESTNSSANIVIQKTEIVDPMITMSLTKFKSEIVSNTTEQLPIEIDVKESTESTNSSANIVIKKIECIDPMITMPSTKFKSEIVSNTTEQLPIENDVKESTESTNSSANIVIKKIESIDPMITMTSTKFKSEIVSNTTEQLPIENEVKGSTESTNSSANIVIQKIEIVGPMLTMTSTKFKSEIVSNTTEQLPIESDVKESTESTNSSANIVIKKIESIDPMITMTSTKFKSEIFSTSEEQIPIDIDVKKSTESSNSSKPKIWVIDPKKIMDENKYTWYINIFLDKKPHSTNVEPIKSALNKNLNLIEIEKLYNKYFSKFVQDTIEIIANLHIIYATICIEYIKRIKKSFMNKSEAEKLKEKYDAKFLLERQTKILEIKVNIHITNVVSLFFESEFEKAFKMFFLSILTVIRVLKMPKYWKGDMFKNLSQFLLNSLKNYENTNSRIFSMLQSNNFRLDCMNMMLEIEDSKENDSRVTDRLTSFFVTSVNSQNYFQKIINAIVSKSAVDLGILIDEASFQCSVNSTFKDPICSSTVQEYNDEIPETNTIQSPINSDEKIIHSEILK